MSVQAIERELENFAWEYIALSDLAQTDAYYAEGEKVLDARKIELTEELNLRNRERANSDHNAQPAEMSPRPVAATGRGVQSAVCSFDHEGNNDHAKQ